MTALRIAFDARYINDRYQGIGRYAFRLLDALVAAAPQHTFIVFQGKEQNSRFDWQQLVSRPNVEVRAGPWPLYWPHEQFQWSWLLRRNGADLFHTPYFVVPLMASVPIIATVHDLIFDRYPAYMPWAWSRPYYRLLMRWGTRRSRRIIAVSQHTAADLAHYYGTPPQKTVVVPEGADPSFKPVTDAMRLEELRERHGLSRPFVLTVGVRRPHKNFTRLVQAFASLAQETTHDLVFVGPLDGRFSDEARQAADALGLDGRVAFLNWVAETDLPGLYSLADLVILPSLMEGFGLPALEAMACGTPVVAANNSSLPEVLGDAGILVDPYVVPAIADAMRRLLSDEALRRRLSVAGLERAASLSWEKAAQQILAAYQEVAPR